MVELMVALALGLLLTGALITLVVSTVSNRSELDKVSRQIEGGRYALRLLSEEIEAAGFLGKTSPPSWARGTATLVACPTDVSGLGYNVAGSPPTLPLAVQMLTTTPTCLSSANVKPTTAMLLVTRASTQEVLTTAAVNSEAYVQVSNCGNAIPAEKPMAVGLGGSSAFNLHEKNCTTPALLRQAIQRIYFIASCNECESGKNDGIPTLKFVEYTNKSMSAPIPVADGIDDMQFDYGVDMDGNGSPDCYVSRNYAATPAYVTDDSAICPTPATYKPEDVVTVRVSLLSRTTEKPSGLKDDGRTFNLGLAKPSVGPFTDGYKRVAYSTVARIVNISAPREVP